MPIDEEAFQTDKMEFENVIKQNKYDAVRSSKIIITERHHQHFIPP